jgi:hypothetical protein
MAPEKTRSGRSRRSGRSDRSESTWYYVITYLLVPLVILLTTTLMVMLAWNNVMPYVFGLPKLSFFQALLLRVVCRFLFSELVYTKRDQADSSRGVSTRSRGRRDDRDDDEQAGSGGEGFERSGPDSRRRGDGPDDDSFPPDEPGPAVPVKPGRRRWLR